MQQTAANSELMTQPPNSPQTIEQLQLPLEQPTWRQRAKMAVGLGIISVGAFWSEQIAHLSQQLPQPAEAISESMAHPVIGNAGALLCALVVSGKFVSERLKDSHAGLASRKWINGHMLASSVTVATGGDVAVEVLQSAIITNGSVFSSFTTSQLPETAKDYLFTLGGIGLFQAHSKVHYWWQRRQAKRTDSVVVAEALEPAA